jgi:hypothetical protein
MNGISRLWNSIRTRSDAACYSGCVGFAFVESGFGLIALGAVSGFGE